MGWHEDALELNAKGYELADIVTELSHYFEGDTSKQIRKRLWLYLNRQGQSINKKCEDKQTVEYTNDEIVSTKFIELKSGAVLTPKELLELHGFDALKWEVANCVNNFWNSQLTGGILQVSYQSKLTARPVKEPFDFSAIDAHFAKLETPFSPPARVHHQGDMLAVVHMADIHLGKLCWHGDTGNDYDLKIARQMYYDLIMKICGELKTKPVEKIVYCWSNDFFNSDNEAQTTTKGTPQDTDGRWAKMLNIGCTMLVDGAGMLADIAPVETFYLPSNHDKKTAYTALKYLEAWYRNDSDVQTEIDAYPRKYKRYGNVLLGFTHGDAEGKESASAVKASRLASVMPNEARQLWGQTTHHEMHAAHLHSEQMIQEINGVIVRRISSPTAHDAWHTDSGYIGTVRKAQTFLYDKDDGLMQIVNTPV